jgi:hypothetical protein
MAERTGYSDAVAVRRPAGAIIIDGQQVADTLQCCHGGEHWIVRKGSGIRRGWCMNCSKPTCGAPKCDPCVPFDKKLTLFEKGILKAL